MVTPPSIEFSSRKNNDPEMSRGIIPDELADNVTTQRSRPEDGEEFNRDNDWVGRAPTEINARVFFPW
jgi:hypothetical protein